MKKHNKTYVFMQKVLRNVFELGALKQSDILIPNNAGCKMIDHLAGKN